MLNIVAWLHDPQFIFAVGCIVVDHFFSLKQRTTLTRRNLRKIWNLEQKLHTINMNIMQMKCTVAQLVIIILITQCNNIAIKVHLDLYLSQSSPCVFVYSKITANRLQHDRKLKKVKRMTKRAKSFSSLNRFYAILLLYEIYQLDLDLRTGRCFFMHQLLIHEFVVW